MRTAGIAIGILFLFSGCQRSATGPGWDTFRAVEAGGPLDVGAVDDNVQHDTLLVQVTFDLRDGTCLMVASHREERFEGLRLYRYIPKKDSSATCMAVSSPAYDSWTMLPTFFRDPLDSTALLLATNLGERDSWGQKVLKLSAQGFEDICFLDVALPERVQEEDTVVLRKRNIAPHLRCTSQGDTLRFSFVCDSVFLYDDLRGRTDLVVPGKDLQYLWVPDKGLSLQLFGEPRYTNDLHHDPSL